MRMYFGTTGPLDSLWHGKHTSFPNFICTTNTQIYVCYVVSVWMAFIECFETYCIGMTHRKNKTHTHILKLKWHKTTSTKTTTTETTKNNHKSKFTEFVSFLKHFHSTLKKEKKKMKITKCCLWQIKSPKKCISCMNILHVWCVWQWMQSVQNNRQYFDAVCVCVFFKIASICFRYNWHWVLFNLVQFEISLDVLLCHVCMCVYTYVYGICIYYLNFWTFVT